MSIRLVSVLAGLVLVVAQGRVAVTEAVGPLAAKCVVTKNYDDQSQRTLNVYVGNLIIDPQTQQVNASARYEDPATGELGAGSMRLDPSGTLMPVQMVMTGSPAVGNATRQRTIRFQGTLNRSTLALSNLSGDQSSLITSGMSFTLQVRTFTGTGQCGLAEDP